MPAAAPLPAHAGLYAKMLTIQKRLLSGVGTRALVPSELDPSERDTAQPNTYFPTSDDGCPLNLGNNVKVGADCLIGAGAVVVKDVPEDTLVRGNLSDLSKPLSARRYSKVAKEAA